LPPKSFQHQVTSTSESRNNRKIRQEAIHRTETQKCQRSFRSFVGFVFDWFLWQVAMPNCKPFTLSFRGSLCESLRESLPLFSISCRIFRHISCVFLSRPISSHFAPVQLSGLAEPLLSRFDLALALRSQGGTVGVAVATVAVLKSHEVEPKTD